MIVLAGLYLYGYHPATFLYDEIKFALLLTIEIIQLLTVACQTVGVELLGYKVLENAAVVDGYLVAQQLLLDVAGI